jgi:glycosyltransferase involved in cell wall biosynthesis
MRRAITLGLLPPLNSGLKTLAQAGQHTRLIEQYFRAYALAFDETLYFSYVNERLQDYTENHGLQSRVRVMPGGPGRLYTFGLPFRWAQELRRCNVLRVFQITGAIPAAMARARWGLPFAATYGYRYARVAHTEGHRRRAVMLWALEQIGLRTANAVIVTTPALARHVKGTVAAERVHLIPNSVDVERFTPPAHLPGRRTLIFVGRLEPQKNLLMLIDALSRYASLHNGLAQTRPAPHLVIVGDGSQREAVASAAALRGVSIEMRGVLDHEALPAVLRTADVFVLPSLAEGHPKALLEAMSCGLPCVGLNVPGTRDVLRHEETGLLCEPNAEALAAGLGRALEDTALANRLGRAARAWIRANYSAQVVMQQEIELLYRLAGTGAPSEWRLYKGDGAP